MENSKGKSLLWILILVIVVIAGVIVGYGLWGGAKTKKFATEAEKVFQSSQTKWKTDQITEPKQAGISEENITELRSFYQKIYNDSNSALNQINGLSQTSKTKTLKTNLDKFYGISKKASKNALDLVNYIDLMAKIGENMNPSISATGIEELKQQLSDFKKVIDKDIKKLKSAKTTASIEKFNQEMTAAMTEMSKLLGEAIDALNKNQPQEIERIMADFNPIIRNFTSLKMPSEDEIKKDIISESENNQLKDLNNEISQDIAALKQVKFAF